MNDGMIRAASTLSGLLISLPCVGCRRTAGDHAGGMVMVLYAPTDAPGTAVERVARAFGLPAPDPRDIRAVAACIAELDPLTVAAVLCFDCSARAWRSSENARAARDLMRGRHGN